MPRPTAPLILVSAALALACGGLAADVDGTSLTVDGSAWAVETCTNGQVRGFPGIELSGVDGSRLRFATQPDGTVEVFYLSPGATTGASLGVCGAMAFEQTGLTVNDVKGLRGGGSVACEGGAHSVTGVVQVDRCATALF